ncbi:MAG: hypothetical protein LBN30_09670 [Oscillospiraceae bacterium]|jgi:hypothetical protein|nr:hypothetical protein [Oscillospiraceae bacterium]
MDEQTQKLLGNDCKVYVSVNEDRTADGRILPRSFVWEDGVRYEIDHVLDVRRAASLRAGGVGLRYTVRIQGRERFMWLEDDDAGRWFMERRE